MPNLNASDIFCGFFLTSVLKKTSHTHLSWKEIFWTSFTVCW